MFHSILVPLKVPPLGEKEATYCSVRMRNCQTQLIYNVQMKPLRFVLNWIAISRFFVSVAQYCVDSDYRRAGSRVVSFSSLFVGQKILRENCNPVLKTHCLFNPNVVSPNITLVGSRKWQIGVGSSWRCFGKCRLAWNTKSLLPFIGVLFKKESYGCHLGINNSVNYYYFSVHVCHCSVGLEGHSLNLGGRFLTFLPCV